MRRLSSLLLLCYCRCGSHGGGGAFENALRARPLAQFAKVLQLNLHERSTYSQHFARCDAIIFIATHKRFPPGDADAALLPSHSTSIS